MPGARHALRAACVRAGACGAAAVDGAAVDGAAVDGDRARVRHAGLLDRQAASVLGISEIRSMVDDLIAAYAALPIA